MDELAKTEARNYLCAAGFFLIAAWAIFRVFLSVGTSTYVPTNENIDIALGIGLFIVATLLIVLHKRDMIAILFFMMGFYQLFCAFTTAFGLWNVIMVAFILLVLLVTLTGQDKKKWMLFLILLIWAVYRIINLIAGFNSNLSIIFFIIIAALCLYYAFCCACERISLPGAKILTADAKTDFKASGSVLGYMLFGLTVAVWSIIDTIGESSKLPLATLQSMELLCGILLIFVAILLLAVGKMRFTPVMFLLMGITTILGVYSSGAMFIGIGILWVALGLFAILRKESRILPGIMLLLTGVLIAFSSQFGQGATLVAVGIIEIIVAAIAVYLSFVVYSQRKLPKF